MTKPVWIGRIDVQPQPGNEALGEAAGAYVHAFIPADSSEEFVAVATRIFEGADYDVVGIEDVEPFEERRQRTEQDPRLVEIARQVEASQEPAVDDEWFAYADDEADD
jgi:hypothetical protein